MLAQLPLASERIDVHLFRPMHFHPFADAFLSTSQIYFGNVVEHLTTGQLDSSVIHEFADGVQVRHLFGVAKLPVLLHCRNKLA